MHNKTFGSPEHLVQRGTATQSEFYRTVLQENPHTFVHVGARASLARYPNGIADLPSKARYKGRFRT